MEEERQQQQLKILSFPSISSSAYGVLSCSLRYLRPFPIWTDYYTLAGAELKRTNHKTYHLTLGKTCIFTLY